MNCHDFLQILDETPERRPSSPNGPDHAAACPPLRLGASPRTHPRAARPGGPRTRAFGSRHARPFSGRWEPLPETRERDARRESCHCEAPDRATKQSRRVSQNIEIAASACGLLAMTAFNTLPLWLPAPFFPNPKSSPSPSCHPRRLRRGSWGEGKTPYLRAILAPAPTGERRGEARQSPPLAPTTPEDHPRGPGPGGAANRAPAPPPRGPGAAARQPPRPPPRAGGATPGPRPTQRSCLHARVGVLAARLVFLSSVAIMGPGSLPPRPAFPKPGKVVLLVGEPLSSLDGLSPDAVAQRAMDTDRRVARSERLRVMWRAAVSDQLSATAFCLLPNLLRIFHETAALIVIG